MNEHLETALKYAERGWYVYAPSGADNENYYTTNPTRIHKYYAKNPDAGVKIDLELSKLVQIEFAESADLTKFGIPLGIETLRSESPRSSSLFFKAPDRKVPTGKVADDVAVRTKGEAWMPPTAGVGQWVNGYDEPTPLPNPGLLIAASIKYQKEQSSSRGEWPEPLDLVALSEHAPEQPRFIMDDWLPCGYATLFAGHGGVGKSGVALHLAVCIAAGVPFFGLRVARRRVLYLSCEDRENVLHWRLSRICTFLGIDLANLAGWLGLLDLVGKPTVLWDKDGFATAYSELNARIKADESQVLIADGIADTFGGNENARTEVKAFVNSLLALVPADDGAVLLVGHISKPVASNGVTSEGYSGSTGWHNSVRARWYLYPETSGGERTGDLKLELQKSNLGPTDRALNFRWDPERHLFVGAAVADLDAALRDEDERAGIIAAMQACPVPVPTASAGVCTTFHVLSMRPEFPPTLLDAKGKKRFWRHIEVLRQAGAIAEDEIPAKGGHKKSVWIARGGF